MTEPTADDPHAPRPLRVAMAVASGIEQDARVRKTALAVADAGHDVTLLYGRPRSSAPAEGTLGSARTLAVQLSYQLRDARAAGITPPPTVWENVAASREELAVAQRRSALRSLRAADAGVVERSKAAAEAAVVRVRTSLRDRLDARASRRSDKAAAAGKPVDPLDWRAELVNVGDLDLTFTRPLWRLAPDVIHIHDIHLLEAGVLAARRLRGRGHAVSVVYDAHEYIAGMHAATPRLAAAWQAMERELMPEVDAVVTVSEPIAAALQERYDLADRPVVTLNTPSLGQQLPAPEPLREVCGLPATTPLLVYSGVLNPRRGVLTAVDGLVHLPDVHLAIVCVPGVDTPAASVLRDRARENGVLRRVHFVDPVDTDEIVDFLSSADIGVHPMIGGLLNHEMALPNKLFDYVYAGLPVVVSDTSLMGAFVRERKLGEPFRPQDAEDFARAVRQVLDGHETFRTNVMDPVLRTEFAWETQAHQVADLYRRLASGRVPSVPLEVDDHAEVR